MESEYILECINLSKSYGTIPALRGVNLRLCRGRIVGLLGPNGSGKTTLIKLANGLLTPTDGEILINGMKPGVETKKIVSFLPDRDFLPAWMTIEKAMRYVRDFFPDFRLDAASEMIARLGLDPKQKIRTLSKGNREKVSLISAMSRDAKLYLLDEPIAGVDPATRDYILETILQNYAENSTVVISTHLIADVEKILNDVVFIKNGSVDLYRSADEIRETEGMSVDALFREVYRW
ncbi:MAG: ABC transporter ATP-binding protein [Clostridia bacterium]|nr:ABC transporter ATP-binding protein [Clostridia bacterium]